MQACNNQQLTINNSKGKEKAVEIEKPFLACFPENNPKTAVKAKARLLCRKTGSQNEKQEILGGYGFGQYNNLIVQHFHNSPVNLEYH